MTAQNKSASILDLDKQLCFLLYSSSRKMTALYRPLLQKLNLTYPQYLVMLVLWEQRRTEPEQPVSVKFLCERLLLDTGTLTPLLKRMEALNLICRRRSRSDERVVCVELTEKGIRLESDAQSVPETLFCRSSLSRTQLAEIRQHLTGLLDSLTRQADGDQSQTG